MALVLGMGISSSVLAENAVNLGIGTTGIVVEYDKLISEKLHVRGSLQYFTYDEDFEEDDIDYSGEITSSHFGVLADYHPFGGFFRLSAGLFVTDLAFGLDAKTTQAELEIGDENYIIEDGNTDPLRLSADVEFAPISPFLGFGWGNSPGEGFGFSFDVGVLVVGEAEVDYDASGTVTEESTGTTIDVNRNADFQENLQKERDSLEEEFEDFSIYPVVVFGVSYTF